MVNTPPMPTAKELATDPSKILALRVVDLKLILDAYKVEYPKKANKDALAKIVSDVVIRITEADKPVERGPIDEALAQHEKNVSGPGGPSTTPNATPAWTLEQERAYESAITENAARDAENATTGDQDTDTPAEPPKPRHGQDTCRHCKFPAKVRSTGPRIKVGPNRHRQIRQMRCSNPTPHIYAKVTYYNDAGNVIR